MVNTDWMIFLSFFKHRENGLDDLFLCLQQGLTVASAETTAAVAAAGRPLVRKIRVILYKKMLR